MANPFRSSFFGLPVPGFELGASELIGNLIGAPRNAEGGSQVIEKLAGVTNNQNNNSTSEPNYSQSPSASYSPLSGFGSVLGAIDDTSSGQKNTGGTGSSGGVPTQQNNNGNDQNSLLNPDFGAISELYAPAIDAANRAESSARSGAEEAEKNLLSRVDKSSSDLETKRSNLLGDTQDEQNTFNKTLSDALSTAIRSFNALRQQGISRFGAGNSAAQAIGELVAQEFLRQQGQITEKRAEGDLQFTKERGRINEFVDSSVQDLNLYKEEALTSIRESLRQTIASIDARRGEIESNKTRDKMAAIESARNQISSIQQADTEFRRGLFLEAINNMQQVEGRAFTPQEIIARLQDFESRFSGVSLSPTTTQTSTNPLAYTGANTDNTDELASLTPNSINTQSFLPNYASAFGVDNNTNSYA